MAKQQENPISRYWKESRAELQKVVWPGRKETTNLTLIVLAVTVTMSIAMGLIDFIFSRLFALLVVG